MVVKASSIDRAFSMSKLCKRLGDFETGTYEEVTKKHTPEPVSTVNLEEWQDYQENVSTRKKKQSFSAWLKVKGLHKKAELWRYRRAYDKEQESISTHTTTTTDNSTELKEFERYAHALQADRFRVTCINMKPNDRQKVFILDKKDGITKGFSTQELLQKMPEMRRLQTRRENIYYTPLSTQRHHILIDDMTAESVAKFKQDGFTPAIVLESSPNNYQCILTINKADSPFDREASNRLTEQLNIDEDAMIAMRMRVTGHSREAVQAAITDCAPTIEPERRRKEDRNWQRYAERTVNFAFGVAGDVALMRYERIFDYWRKVERQVQKEQTRMRI